MKLRSVVLVICGGLILQGCAPATDQESAWTAPEWMAEQAQAREEFTVQLQSCISSKGWELTVDESGGFVEGFDSETEMERAKQDSDACLLEQGIDPSTFDTITEEELRVMYKYDQDTYECLVAQDVEMERDFPSVDTYVEQGLRAGDSQDDEEVWTPYLDQGVLSLPQEKLAQVQQSCPERWGFARLK